MVQNGYVPVDIAEYNMIQFGMSVCKISLKKKREMN